MNRRELYSIKEARELLGGISAIRFTSSFDRAASQASFWAAGDSSLQRQSRS
jgi:hypothetical protein